MKSVFVLLALVALASAQARGSTTVRYAGTTIGAQTFMSPTLTPNANPYLPPACAAGTSAVPYQQFSVNVSATAPATGTFYVLRVMFQDTFRGAAEVLVYSTFASATPCMGFVDGYTGSSPAPPVDVFVYWPNGQYVIVITAEGPAGTGTQGIFAANLVAADSTGTTVGASTMWTVPDTAVNIAACDSGSTPVPFKTYTFTATVTAVHDINVYFSNSSFSNSFTVSAAVYTGVWPPVGFTGVLDPCNGTFVAAVYGDFGDRYTTVTLPLTSGNMYTVAFSGTAADEIGFYGVVIGPTIFKTTTGSPTNWNAPTVPALATSTTCTDSGTAKNYDITIITAEYTTYIVDTGVADFDTAAVLYYGNNVAVGTTPPSTCTNFLIVGDTGDGGPLAFQGIIPGFNYTVIVTGYGSGSGDYTLWALTGVQLGVIPPPPTTTGVPIPTGETTEEGSPAAINAVSVVLLLVCALFAKF
jgi:hypothetical protein